MAQNTNASALIRLRPIKGANIGAIVEEHVRYWKKHRDAEEAAKLAQKARQQEFQRKINKDTFEIYNGLQPEENAGFLNSQIIDRFEENKPYYMKLAKAAAAGNVDARLRLADEKRRIESAVSINKVYSEKIKTLEKQKREGTFNELLDNDVERFKQSILSGKYKLNADWTLDVYSPALEENLKGTSSGLFKDGIVRLNSSSLFNNDFLNSTFSKKANFLKNGQDIAKNLLDTNNGNKQITAQTKRDGVRLVRGVLSQDGVEARSWYRDARNKGLVKFKKPLGELSEVEQNVLAEQYYEQFVLPNIEEVDNSLSNANTRSSIVRRRFATARERRQDDKDRTTISLSTDTQGNALISASIKDQTGEEFATEQATVFNLAGKPITVGVKGKSGSNVTYTDLVKTADGKVIAVGQRVEKVDVPVTNQDGTIKVDSNGNDITRAQERVMPVFETDEKVLNNISRLIDNDDKKKLENLNQLSLFLDDKQVQQKQRINNTEDRGILD